MKIKMLEYFQGTNLPSLVPGEVCEVGQVVEQELANWLLEHRKAVLVEEPKPVEEPRPQVVEKPKPVQEEKSILNKKPAQGREKRGGRK